MRVARDWSDAVYPLNSALANPFVQYGTMDESSSLTAPGAVMSGIDLQDCFLHWLAAPSRRRLLGVRHPATGVLGAYIFLPFWLGPPPGRNDACVQALLMVARSRLQRLGFLDFMDDGLRARYLGGRYGRRHVAAGRHGNQMPRQGRQTVAAHTLHSLAGI